MYGRLVLLALAAGILAESAYGEAMSDILLRQAVGIDVIESVSSDEKEIGTE